MTKEDKKLLTESGWEIECESPFEIRHEDGSTASGAAAIIVLASLREDAKCRYTELEKSLKGLPITWYPALLKIVAEEAYKTGKVFKPGGASRLISNLEKKSGWDNKENT